MAIVETGNFLFEPIRILNDIAKHPVASAESAGALTFPLPSSSAGYDRAGRGSSRASLAHPSVGAAHHGQVVDLISDFVNILIGV